LGGIFTFADVVCDVTKCWLKVDKIINNEADTCKWERNIVANLPNKVILHNIACKRLPFLKIIFKHSYSFLTSFTHFQIDF
jgi:hypothetical protein